MIQNITDTQLAFINQFTKDLSNTKNHNEALKVLFDNVENGNLTTKNGILYKHGEYYIQNLFKSTGTTYKNTLEQLKKTNTSITPQLIESIEKDGEIFILSKIKGTKTGDLIPLSEIKDKIPKENLLKAFQDLQKITKAGFTDNKILNSPNCWFVTPDDMSIVLPEWGQIRPLQLGEGEKILKTYYNILFKED